MLATVIAGCAGEDISGGRQLVPQVDASVLDAALGAGGTRPAPDATPRAGSAGEESPPPRVDGGGSKDASPWIPDATASPKDVSVDLPGAAPVDAGTTKDGEGSPQLADVSDAVADVLEASADAAPDIEVTPPSSCTDGIWNGLETDIDCGGADCSACVPGQACEVPNDCSTGVCAEGACSHATCDDLVRNGTETGVDCGGPDCDACASGQSCLSGQDCQSLVCWYGTCASPTCGDGVRNGAEPDVDCGTCQDTPTFGTCSGASIPGPKCAVGRNCLASSDCASSVCLDGTCAEPSCTDGAKNGNETDVDCGGRCPPCDLYALCAVAGDCETLTCGNPLMIAPSPPRYCPGVCFPAHCRNGVLDGDETSLDAGGSCAFGANLVCSYNNYQDKGETGVDCGGGCRPCAEGVGCVTDMDCISLACVNKICVPASCTDGWQNGEETDFNCGGTTCLPCAVGQECAASSDCENASCVTGRCQPETCANGLMDASESGMDCGGPDCASCPSGATCVLDSDCESGVCLDGLCAEPACGDGVRNGSETDIDCGLACLVGCPAGARCVTPYDCESHGPCVAGFCQEPTYRPSCSNGYRDGDETGKDCGGSMCAGCEAGEPCNEASDCASGHCIGHVCSSGLPDGAQCWSHPSCLSLHCTTLPGCSSYQCSKFCVPASCDDGIHNGDEFRTDCGPSCTTACCDGIQNGDESDVDCGGSCPKCVSGATCETPWDCRSNFCGYWYLDEFVKKCSGADILNPISPY
jgi:hypothetical protein